MPARALAPAAAFAIAALGIAMFSGMDAVMKALVIAIGTYNALLWRTVIGVVLSGAVYFGRRRRWPEARAMRVHLIRGIVSAAMAILFFWGLARVPMAQAIALAFIAPLIALVLAAVLLGERIGRATIGASVVAFAGVIVILTGQARAAIGPEVFRGALAVLASALCYALNIILMRRQSQLAGPIEVTFFQTVIMLGCIALAAPWWIAWPPTAWWPLIALAAVLTLVSLALLSWAYAHGEASYLAPTEYTSFVWAGLLGWIVFGEHLSPWTLAGAALIVGGCLIAARAKPQPLAEPVA